MDEKTLQMQRSERGHVRDLGRSWGLAEGQRVP